MSAIDVLITDLKGQKGSAQAEPIIVPIDDFVAALNFISGGGTGALPGSSQNVAATPFLLPNLGYVGINNTSGGILVVNQGTIGPIVDGSLLVIKDEGGNAGANKFTVTLSTNIDGGASGTIQVNYGFICIRFSLLRNQWFTAS